MAGVGWSVGDIIAGIRLTVKVVEAFKSSSGASVKYQQEVRFLENYRKTLEHLKCFIHSHVDGPYITSISEELAQVEKPWKNFKAFLNKYERSLKADSCRSSLLKAPRTIQYSFKDLAMEVNKFRTAIDQHFQLLNTLLSLQTIHALGEMKQNLYGPQHCGQLIEILNLTFSPNVIVSELQSIKERQIEQRFALDSRLQSLEGVFSQKMETAIAGMSSGEDVIANRIKPMIESLNAEQTCIFKESMQKMIISLRMMFEQRIDRLKARSSQNTSHDTIKRISPMMATLAMCLTSLALGISGGLVTALTTAPSVHYGAKGPPPTKSYRGDRPLIQGWMPADDMRKDIITANFQLHLRPDTLVNSGEFPQIENPIWRHWVTSPVRSTPGRIYDRSGDLEKYWPKHMTIEKVQRSQTGQSDEQSRNPARLVQSTKTPKEKTKNVNDHNTEHQDPHCSEANVGSADSTDPNPANQTNKAPAKARRKKSHDSDQTISEREHRQCTGARCPRPWKLELEPRLHTWSQRNVCSPSGHKDTSTKHRDVSADEIWQ